MLAFCLVGVAAVPEEPGPPVCGPPVEPGRPYAAASPFNRPIAANPRVDPNSAQLVAGVVRAARERGFVLSVREWTVPVYYADEETPRYDVPLTPYWAGKRVLREVPIPDDARPDPMADGHLAVVDRVGGCEYDFWQAERTPDGRWTASWGRRLPATGDGIASVGPSARASGFGLLAGLVFPDELARGRIEHALVFGYPYTRAGGPVAPATSSDGRTAGAGALPEGARLQLDPALDLDTLVLTPYERAIAEAMQQYGMFLGDTGGAVGVFAAHPHPFGEDPYAALLPPGGHVPLDGIPVERLRVLDLPG